MLHDDNQILAVSKDTTAEAAEAWGRWMDLVYGRLEGEEAFLAEHLLVSDEVAWEYL